MLKRLSQLDPFEAVENEGGFDLREIVSFVWRQWMFIAAVVGISVLIGVVSLLRETPLYQASAQVLLDPQRAKLPGAELMYSDLYLDQSVIENQMAILLSSAFLRRVVEREHLAADSAAGSAGSQTGPAAATAGTANAPDRTGTISSLRDPQYASPEVIAATEALKGTLAVTAEKGHVITITVTSADPARAAKLANAVADAYLVDKLDARLESAQTATKWLGERLVSLRNQLRESEGAVAKFRAQHGLHQAGNLTLNQQQLSEISAKLIEAKADAAQKKARADLVVTLETDGGNLLSLPEISNAGALPGLRQQSANLSQQEADLLARYGAPHPLVVNVRAQQRDVDRAIRAEVKRLADGIKSEHELAQARVASFERSLQQATGQVDVDNETAIQLRELERAVAVNKTLFEEFLQKAKISQEQSTFEGREARVITRALPPGVSSYPNSKKYLTWYVLIGMALGVGGAYAKEKLNSGFTTPKQVEELLNLPVLSSVGRMGSRDLMIDGKVVALPHHPIAKPLSRFSESVRSLRTGIQMTNVDDPPKVVQVTSMLPSEGKTTIALSIAASAASSGLRVLLIDADLRRPSASQMFGLKNEFGLVDLLLGDVGRDQAVRYSEDERYWVLPAGNKTQNPPDLLGSDRMKSIIADAKQTFDLVVIDTPPAGPVIDPAVVAQLSDTIILVVRWASTSREMVRSCAQQLAANARIAGIVFNQVNERAAKKYGTMYSYYYRSKYYLSYYSDQG